MKMKLQKCFMVLTVLSNYQKVDTLSGECYCEGIVDAYHTIKKIKEEK